MKPDIIRTHPYIDAQRSKGFAYYVIPKAMLKAASSMGIGFDEVMLYSVIKDRTTLSYKNRWHDEDGKVYVYYGRQEASEYLGWSQRKTVSVFANLIRTGLLSEKEQKSNGLKKAKKLYLHQWIEPGAYFGADGSYPFLTEKNIAMQTGAYYVVPKCLFENEIYEGLSLRAVMIYAIALDQISLSVANNQVDENGLVWCVLDSKYLQNLLSCSDKTLYGEYKLLEQSGLIVRQKVTQENFYRTYLRDYMPVETAEADNNIAPDNAEGKNNVRSGSFCTTDRKNLHHEEEKNAPRDGEICTSNRKNLQNAPENFAGDDRKNLHPNKPLEQSFSIYPDRIILADGAADASVQKKNENILFRPNWESELKKLLMHESLLEDIDIATNGVKAILMKHYLDIAESLMAEDLNSIAPQVRIANRLIPHSELQTCYTSITRYQMFAFLSKVAELGDEIEDVPAYIHSSLPSVYIDYEGQAVYAQREIEEKRRERAISKLQAAVR